MPNRDQTGPQGNGPQTGRGLGRCNPQNDENPTSNRIFGRGRRGNNRSGRGRAGGRGRGAGRPGRGRGAFFGETANLCICPECGFKSDHAAGMPCNQQTCPECGALMNRK